MVIAESAYMEVTKELCNFKRRSVLDSVVGHSPLGSSYANFMHTLRMLGGGNIDLRTPFQSQIHQKHNRLLIQVNEKIL